MSNISEIISVRSALYLCNEISIRKPLVDVSHIQLFCFSFEVFYDQNEDELFANH